MTRPSRFLGIPLGEWNKEQYLAASIDDLTQAEQAIRELEQTGWSSEDAKLVQGKSATHEVDQIEGLSQTLKLSSLCLEALSAFK